MSIQNLFEDELSVLRNPPRDNGPAPLMVRFKRLRPCATMPTRGSQEAAGWDLYAAVTAVVRAGSTEVVGSGWAMELPPGWECQVRSRSGLACLGVTVANSPGTIDSDYRGEVAALLTVKAGCEDFLVSPGDRIAQLVFARVPRVVLTEVDASEELRATKRGDKGWGSTGV